MYIYVVVYGMVKCYILILDFLVGFIKYFFECFGFNKMYFGIEYLFGLFFLVGKWKFYGIYKGLVL